MHELRFWCQYWIIVAVLTVFDSIGDMLMSWLPIYGELKLALIIYLWYPKTKGTGYVYETLLRPYVAMREHDIDRSLQELRVRVWDLALYYWQNFSSLGQTKFFEIVQFITSQLGKITKSNNETADQHLEKLANQFQLKNERHNPEPSAPPLSPPRSSSFNFFANRKQPSDHRRRPPMPPPSPGRVYRSVAQPPKSNVVQVHLHNQTEYVHTLTHEELDPADFSSGSGSPDESDTVINRRLNGTKFRFRRSK
ncbi:hypothetical protein Vadar_021539 [Vaccinium darrowii]|uniref:Uncharacterized protein n=1 Tax=Vaccinium darrowii TaxID=229202 RepID=A0ACB7YNZ0_9ERIC|nr:hypothetical protein Vadar_021539 [Vaccinium darrowii]